MPEKVGSYDAKSRLPEILRRVEAGEVFTITNRGRPVADFVPSRASRRMRTKSAIDSLLKARKRKLSDKLLDELKESGRK